jgi:SAM-dependent methyltransferase
MAAPIWLRGHPGFETADEFSLFLHELRTRELERLPSGAKVVLSGGASGAWYFDWFQSHYPSTVERHVGVEAFAPEPDGLPPNVEWVSGSLKDLGPIPSGSVDLVFGGQVIEHLWPDEISGFLVSAHRTLRKGGCVALDSPNRRVTQSIGWAHPEHTVEFTVDEIVELLRASGFDDIQVRGVLQAYDTATHRYLTLPELAAQRSLEGAEGSTSRPEDAFVWWAEATRRNRKPDERALERRVSDLFNRFRRHRLSHAMSCEGDVVDVPHLGRVVRSSPGQSGPILFGPYIPVQAGSWTASFDLAAADASRLSPGLRIARIEVTHGSDATALAVLQVNAGDLRGDGRWSRHDVSFTVAETVTGAEFRVVSDGRADLLARGSIELQPAGQIEFPAQPSRRRRVAKRLTRLLAG